MDFISTIFNNKIVSFMIFPVCIIIGFLLVLAIEQIIKHSYRKLRTKTISIRQRVISSKPFRAIYKGNSVKVISTFAKNNTRIDQSKKCFICYTHKEGQNILTCRSCNYGMAHRSCLNGGNFTCPTCSAKLIN